MAKNLKLNIKNAQIAQAVNLDAIKGKLGKKKGDEKSTSVKSSSTEKSDKKDEPIKIKARSKSAFADGNIPQAEVLHPNLYSEEQSEQPVESDEENPSFETFPKAEEIEAHREERKIETPEALRAKLFKDVEEDVPHIKEPLPEPIREAPKPPPRQPITSYMKADRRPPSQREYQPRERLGPTGKHVKDLIPPPRPVAPPRPRQEHPQGRAPYPRHDQQGRPDQPRRPYPDRGQYQDRGPRAPIIPPTIPPKEDERSKFKDKTKTVEAGDEKKSVKSPAKFREFRDLKPSKRPEASRQFDGRDRQGLRANEDEEWRGRKRSSSKGALVQEETVRPSSLKIRVPITIKDLAEKMKLKASQLIGKLFLQGTIVTLNDYLEDETMIQLLGNDFGCEISLDTSEEERIRVTDKTIQEETAETDPSLLQLRPPVVAFMGHVDHGKTSLIDAIRSSNRVAGEAGAITQHIGAFKCNTPVGSLTILDTPGHEAFSAMRARGADVTDIVVLVVAGDEGLRQQTLEAIQHAKAAEVTLVVAINKSDKPNYNPETVYRQLSEQELLPEAWGGQTITVNCSAVTKQGIPELLEMLALQAEVLELKANPSARARGTVIESEMHKGMGAVATVLVQNGTLRQGDAIVFGQHFGRIKTMRDENGIILQEASPSTPVSITGLSGLPEAGQEFIVVKNEKEAKEISDVRTQDVRQVSMRKKALSMDNLLEKASLTGKKILNIVLRADVQGSLEALKTILMKIDSQKAELNIIFTGVGEISESDVQLAAASKAIILGFHTQIEGHADNLVKELDVKVRLHDIIYHAVDDVKMLMAGLLDKIPQETEKGKALVKAIFKSSQHGMIAGCQVIEGTISRGNMIRVVRDKKVIWKGGIASLKRVKEDVKEVAKGLECGILLTNFNDAMENDIFEAYEITYLTQEL